MEADLDYIGATRRDRIIAEQFRRQHQKRLEWVARWLDRFGWTFDLLPAYLSEQIPYLANRGGEALRALVAACILDHDDIATLALSIEGLKSVMEYAADGRQSPTKAPARAARPRREPAHALAPRESNQAAPVRPLRASVLSVLRPGLAQANPRLSAPASPGDQGLGQGRPGSGKLATPGPSSRPGCATFSCEPTSGATRSWC